MQWSSTHRKRQPLSFLLHALVPGKQNTQCNGHPHTGNGSHCPSYYMHWCLENKTHNAMVIHAQETAAIVLLTTCIGAWKTKHTMQWSSTHRKRQPLSFLLHALVPRKQNTQCNGHPRTGNGSHCPSYYMHWCLENKTHNAMVIHAQEPAAIVLLTTRIGAWKTKHTMQWSSTHRKRQPLSFLLHALVPGKQNTQCNGHPRTGTSSHCPSYYTHWCLENKTHNAMVIHAQETAAIVLLTTRIGAWKTKHTMQWSSTHRKRQPLSFLLHALVPGKQNTQCNGHPRTGTSSHCPSYYTHWCLENKTHNAIVTHAQETAAIVLLTTRIGAWKTKHTMQRSSTHRKRQPLSFLLHALVPRKQNTHNAMVRIFCFPCSH